MEFRKAVIEDISDIMNIINQAKAYFKEAGINQWQNVYPNDELIKQDIDTGYGYILSYDNKIVTYAAVSFDGEKTYDVIYEGQWLTNNNYAVIHRIAVDNNYKGSGLASFYIKNVENICLNKDVYSIKIDTHEKNLSMQKMLKKNNFQYCGIIFLEDGSKRIAFEKILNASL